MIPIIGGEDTLAAWLRSIIDRLKQVETELVEMKLNQSHPVRKATSTPAQNRVIEQTYMYACQVTSILASTKVQALRMRPDISSIWTVNSILATRPLTVEIPPGVKVPAVGDYITTMFLGPSGTASKTFVGTVVPRYVLFEPQADFWVEINTVSDNGLLFGWRRVSPYTDGSFITDNTTPSEGTFTENPAYEANGMRGLAPPFYTKLRRDVVSPDLTIYLFEKEPITQVVRITSSSPNSEGLYPGVVEEYDEEADEWIERESCLVKDLND